MWKIKKKNIKLLKPQTDMTGDNAAMIAWVCKNKINKIKPDLFFKPNPRLTLN